MAKVRFDESDFQLLEAKYDDDKEKCYFIYQVEDNRKRTITFDDSEVDLSEGDTKVTCKKNDKKPQGGIELELEADIDMATWLDKDGEECDINYARVTWDDDKDLKLEIRREEKLRTTLDDFKYLKVEYDEKDEKCKLTYKIPGNSERKIKFTEKNEVKEKKDGYEILCRKDNKDPEGGVKLGVDFEIPLEYVTWEKGDEEKEVTFARFYWSESDKDLKITIRRN
jgi:hypothetical protein